MTTEDLEFVAFQEPPHPVLVEWFEDVPALIAGLSLRLPAGMRLDLSRESLVELNAFVLARFPDKRSARADDELTRDLVIRLAVYLGEAWLRRLGQAATRVINRTDMPGKPSQPSEQAYSCASRCVSGEGHQTTGPRSRTTATASSRKSAARRSTRSTQPRG